jgi:hypothetical protein
MRNVLCAQTEGEDRGGVHGAGEQTESMEVAVDEEGLVGFFLELGALGRVLWSWVSLLWMGVWLNLLEYRYLLLSQFFGRKTLLLYNPMRTTCDQ